MLEDSVLVEQDVARNQDASAPSATCTSVACRTCLPHGGWFVNIGRGRNAVLYSGEVDWDAVETGNQPRRIELALKSGDRRARAGHGGPGRPQGRAAHEPDLAARPLPRLRPGRGDERYLPELPDTERARLKKILKEVLPALSGVIVVPPPKAPPRIS